MTSGTSTTSSSVSVSSSLPWTMCRFMLRLTSVGTGMVAIVAGLLYAKQESLLYFPEIGGIPRRPASNPRRYRSPSEYNIPYESHMIPCDDGVSIHSWLLLHSNSKEKRKPTIIFFHGNAGNIGLRLPNAHQMYSKLDANVLMVEYRGYGDSDTVKPTEQGLKLDAEAALNFISSHPQIDPHRIFCFGRSLGGAVAFHLAKYAQQYQKPLAGIILENTFLSISKMVDQLMPLIAPLKFLVLRMDWGNDKIAPTVQTPVLYLAGDADELVPHNHMLKLFEYSSKASIYSKMHIIRNGTHNDSWMVGGKEYFERFRAFMSHIMRNEGGKDNNKGQQQDVSSTSFKSIGSLEGESAGVAGESVEVIMGQDSNIEMEKSAIPIMPNSFAKIAKEATMIAKEATRVSDVSDKQKKKN